MAKTTTFARKWPFWEKTLARASLLAVLAVLPALAIFGVLLQDEDCHIRGSEDQIRARRGAVEAGQGGPGGAWRCLGGWPGSPGGCQNRYLTLAWVGVLVEVSESDGKARKVSKTPIILTKGGSSGVYTSREEEDA